MEAGILNKALQWTTSSFDEQTRREIQGLIDNGEEKELEDRFYKDLEFGTGGMRGIMTSGTNRMNTYTVGRATQGLANYLLDTYSDTRDRGVAIAYDSRNNSKLFARESAGVLAGNGVRVFIFKELRPTPLLSFAIRHLNTVSGIVITASHNPREYNGYKVYSPDGGQVKYPEDDRIVKYVNKVEMGKDVKKIKYDEGLNHGLIEELGEEIDNTYLEKVLHFAVGVEKGIQDTLQRVKKNIKIVYTPLHGTGITLVPRALQRVGGAEVICESEQSIPDGNFPTTPSPNPEETGALEKAIKLARRKKADMVLATDPDCDRIGFAVPMGEGKFIPLTGNQIGCLFAHLISYSYSKSGIMPKGATIIGTVVSTELVQDIVREYGVDVIDVLTGFKYIAGKIEEFEKEGSRHFIFGFEESYGYSADTFVREKDGVIASVLALLTVKYAKGEYGSVLKYLHSLYKRFGMHMEYQRSFTLKGTEGEQRIKDLMDELRNDPPSDIKGSRVIRIKDFLAQKVKGKGEGTVEDMKELPKSNVIQIYTEDNIKISARPSGTEPKIKFYFALSMQLLNSIEETKKILDQRYARISSEFFKRYGLG